MAVILEIGGRSFEIAPFMLAELEQAAPHIDRLNEFEQEFKAHKLAKTQPPASLSFKLARELVEIVAVGVSLIDPDWTAERIAKSVGPSFIQPLGVAVRDLLNASGLSPQGESKAPSPRQSKGARASRRK